MSNLLLVDSQSIFMEALSLSLQQESNVHILSSLSSAEEAIRFIEHQHAHIDMVLLSLQMRGGKPEGMYYAEYILQHFPTVQLLVYSVHIFSKIIRQLYQAGIGAFLFKNDSGTEFSTGIQRVLAGRIYLPPTARVILERSYQYDPGPPLPTVNPEALLVLRCLLDGHSNRNIAAKLEVPCETVLGIIEDLTAQVQAKDTADLLRKWLPIILTK